MPIRQKTDNFVDYELPAPAYYRTEHGLMLDSLKTPVKTNTEFPDG